MLGLDFKRDTDGSITGTSPLVRKYANIAPYVPPKTPETPNKRLHGNCKAMRPKALKALQAKRTAELISANERLSP